MANTTKVVARKGRPTIIHEARKGVMTTLCGRRAVWDVHEPYVRTTCPACRELSRTTA